MVTPGHEFPRCLLFPQLKHIAGAPQSPLDVIDTHRGAHNEPPTTTRLGMVVVGGYKGCWDDGCRGITGQSVLLGDTSH